jgi:hypothetical protein
MRHKRTAVLAAMVFGIMMPFLSLEQSAPQLINYQGRLADDQGQPVEGSRQMHFAILDGATASAQVLWGETQTVTVSGGLYHVLLGSLNPVGPAVFSGPVRYLEVKVNGETLSPRQPIASVPYALTVDTQWLKDLDLDGDGHYKPISSLTPHDDCNDNDPTTYFDAPEIVDDRIDQNCDGVDVTTAESFYDGFNRADNTDIGLKWYDACHLVGDKDLEIKDYGLYAGPTGTRTPAIALINFAIVGDTVTAHALLTWPLINCAVDTSTNSHQELEIIMTPAMSTSMFSGPILVGTLWRNSYYDPNPDDYVLRLQLIGGSADQRINISGAALGTAEGKILELVIHGQNATLYVRQSQDMSTCPVLYQVGISDPLIPTMKFPGLALNPRMCGPVSVEMFEVVRPDMGWCPSPGD